MKTKQEIKTVWRLFECGNGRRWSEVISASYYPNGNMNISKDGDTCNFSGCLRDHKIKAVRDTDDVPSDWFRQWPVWEETPQYKAIGKVA